MDLTGYISGDALPLALQLGDGNASMRPFVYLYSSTGSLLSTDEMTHISGGFYRKTGRTFPVSIDYVKAVYIVRKADGLTESTFHSRTEELFSSVGEKDTIRFIQVGQDLPLTLQTYNGNTGKAPIATGFDDSNNMAFSVTLTHVANGFYKYSGSQTMPSTAMLSVQYIVKEPGGAISSGYQRTLEVYQLVTDQTFSKYGLTGNVSASFIGASISATTAIRAAISGGGLAGTVSASNVSAVFSASANLTGIVR